MDRFWLIQRGKFNKEGTTLTGDKGLINLDYMGSAEFEFGAIPKSFRRIMHDFENYKISSTGIHTPDGKELLVYCKKQYSVTILKLIKEYIENPYQLKEYSEMDKIPTATDDDDDFITRRRSDFWWCIDYKGTNGDWMAFLSPDRERFIHAMLNDYKYWWLKKSRKEREEEYRKSTSPYL